MQKIYLLFIILFGAYVAQAQKPVANFGTDKYKLCQNDCISFIDSSTNNPTSWLWTFSGAFPSSSTDKNPSTICYVNAGSFDAKLVASNSYGSDSITKTVTVYPTPTVPAIIESFTYPDTFYVHADPSYVFYEWYFDTTLVSWGTLDTLCAITQEGNVNVAVVDTNCCFVSVGINIIVKAEGNQVLSPRNTLANNPCGITLSSKEQAADNTFLVTPNPANNYITIRTAPNKDEPASISIMNTLGMVVSAPFNVPRPLSGAEVDISKLTQGIYFLQLKTKYGSVVKKFVKQ